MGLAPVLAWVRHYAGPITSALLIAGSTGWYLRDREQVPTELRAAVARLDSTTVKRDTFAQLVREVRETRTVADSTRAMLRRLVCRQYPDICP